MTAVLLIGDVMLDRYLAGSVDRISPEAPVPVLRIRSEFVRPGGVGNVAANIVAMGGNCRLLGAVGADEAARQLRDALGQEGVPPGDLVELPGLPTTTKTRLLAGPTQLARFDREDDANAFGPHEAYCARIEQLLPECSLVVLSDYAKGMCSEPLCRFVIAQARNASLPVIVDPKGRTYDKYAGASVITPNRREASEATGLSITTVDDALRAGRMVQSRHDIRAVVVTLGDKGMAIVDGENASVIPGHPRQVFDVTGAGDTVVAVLAVMIAEGIPLAEACVFANAAGALQVSRVGTSRISRTEVEDSLCEREARAHTKVVRLPALVQKVAQARAEGKRIGFTNGCFDILHHGHVALLEAAAHECDVLIVAVNSDASVTRLKGAPRPFVTSVDRQAVLAGLQSVAWVCDFEADSPLELIRAIQPDVLIKGGDYSGSTIVGADIVLARGGRVVTPVFVNGVSSSNIVDRVVRLANAPGKTG
jgi:D-beta-D-heptose 7-phosphate kinase/D-beta-D-heptose 1-phosphate adenosyltransferase